MTMKIGNRLSDWTLESESISKVKIETNSELKNENSKIKFFYPVIFSALSCLSVITTYNAINDYLKYDVVSQTRIISDQPSLFPKITICSTVTFPTKKASDLIVKIVKRVFGQDLRNFKNFKNLSKIFSSDDFLSLLGIANVMTVSEVILNLN